jgi:hypothetical protein
MTDSEYGVRLRTTGRNDDCPCGSGKKYKKCHLAEDEGASTATLKALEVAAAEKAKVSADADGVVDAQDASEGTRSTKRQARRRRGSKGPGPDGKPQSFPRRGAV